MKRNLLLALFVTVALLISGCPGVPGPGGEPGAPGNNDKYTREFLGEWIRMDTGERWYISGNSISVNGGIEDKTVTLVKSSAQVITVSEAGRADYFLFASRVADAGFSARVVLIDGNETERTAISRAAIPPGGFKIKSPKNPGLEQTVYPDSETGELLVDGVIPGDPVEISPEDPEWNNVNVGVTPEDGQNMGIIPLTHGVNLKASIRLAGSGDITELYADDTQRDYIIEVENIGTVNSIGASYEISWDEEDFELISGNTRAKLDTIIPGAKKQINLTLASKPIANGNKNKEIKVTIISVDAETGNILRWEDTVSVNYYKISVPFHFRSEKPVQGVIRTPRNKTYYFKTSGPNGNCTYSVNLPWSSENYVVTFLGASVETNSETTYSLAIDEQPPSNWDSLWGEDMFRHEAVNKSVNTAPLLNLDTDNRSFMYYLYTGAVQYFRIYLGDTPPASDVDLPETPATPTVTASNRELLVSWQAAARARSYEVWRSTTNSSANAEKYGDDVSGTAATLTGLTNGTTYYIWIKAKNNIGTSGFSSSTNGKPLGTPDKPPILTAGNGLLQVTWSAVAGADEYEVYYGTDAAATLWQTTAGTTATITGLTNDTTYLVRLRAKNSSGISGYGPSANGMPSSVTGTSTRTVTIDMYDSYGDGWDSGGALQINVNGTQIANNVRVSSGSYNTYTFSVTTGDLVQVYWVAGSAQGENSFIVYYTDTPPSPAFTTSNNASWNGSNALIYRLCGTMDSISGGTLLGSFTVQ